MKLLSVCVAFLIAAACFGIARHRSFQSLARELKALQTAADQLQRLERENRDLAKIALDEDRLRQLRQRHLELMRLRSEIGQLEAAAKIEIPEIEKQIAQLSEQSKNALAEGQLVQARFLAKEKSKATQDVLHMVFHWATVTARQNNGQLPSSIDQIQAYVESQPRMRKNLASLFNPNPMGISAQSFQVMAKEPLRIKGPPRLYLGEIQPRQLPDGGWLRYYALSNGEVQEISSANGDFQDWEHRHLALSDPK